MLDGLNRRGFLASVAPALGALSGGVSRRSAGGVTSPTAKNRLSAFRSVLFPFWTKERKGCSTSCVNTPFVATLTYRNGIASRMIPGHPAAV
jgi:hypothetical protein